MRKIFTLLILLMMLPVTALAAETNTVYVGGVALAGSSDSIGYATTNENGEVITEGATADNYNIKWDGSTLTLVGAKIKGAASSESISITVGIYAFNSSGDVSLNIALQGVNEIFESSYGIWVYSYSYSSSTNAGNATLTIEGEGSLNASGSSHGILVQSNSGDAALTIRNADVTAENSSYSGDGVTVRAGSSSSASLSVDGGSLTATGKSELGAGIRYTFGGGSSGSGVPSLTVSGNAMVKASGGKGGISDNSNTDIKIGVGDNSSGGIVFDGSAGTVYGDVTLQEDITIGEGESLTIGQDANLTVPFGTTLTNNGTVTTEGGGTLTNNGKIYNSGTLPDNIQGSAPPKITTASLPNGEVDKNYSQTLASDNNPTNWSITSGSLPAGLTLDTSTGEITGTPTTADTYTFTVTATNTAGSDSKEYTLIIKSVPVTGVKLDKTELSLYTGESALLNATVEPDNATNKTVTWSSNNEAVATVDNGKVTAVAEGEATITVTTEDGSNTAICKVKVTQSTYSITSDIMALDFGSTYIGYTQPTAQTVTITNTGNRLQTLDQPTSTTNFVVGTLSKMELAAGEGTTFTVQPKAGLAVGTYSENITVSSSEGATVTIPTSFNVRKEVKVEPSGSTNLSFTTDRDEFSLTATVHAQGNDLNPKDGSWTWAVADEDVVALSGSPTLLRAFVSSSRQAFTIKGTGTTTITATYDDGTYRGLVEFKVSISKPTPPDPISYYNIYVEDVCDGVEVTTSKNVVREGGSVSVYVKKDTVNYTFDNFKVYYKRSYYGGWEELKEGTQPGEYPIKNIWTHIYIKAEGAEEKEDPTGIESIEGVKVYTKDGSLYVQTPQREQVIIVSMSGAVVKNEEQVGLKQYHGLQSGIYIVRIGDRAYKLRLN